MPRLVTVFGGSGFVGRYVVQRLAERGDRVRVAVRRPNEALFLKPLGDVGQVQTMQANLRDAASVANAVAGADAVMNAVGILFESGKQKFSAIQAEGAGTVAAAAKAAGVRTVVHVSAIGADANGRAKYAASKGRGEALVTEAFPEATILRPSIVFGPEDDFFNRFAAMARLFPVMPLIAGETRFQPVYVGDVADAAVLALDGGPGVAGRTFELGGPKTYSFRELLELVMVETQHQRPLFPVPRFMAAIQAFFLQALPNPPLTPDQLKLLENDNIVSDDARSFAELGIRPTPVEAIVPAYLWRFRPKGQFSENAV